MAYWKSIRGRGGLMGRVWVMPCVGHLIQSLMYSCPQRADSLMNFEGQTFCFLCSFKVPRYPQGCQHSTSFNHRRLMGKEEAVLKERERCCLEEMKNQIDSGTCVCQTSGVGVEFETGRELG